MAPSELMSNWESDSIDNPDNAFHTFFFERDAIVSRETGNVNRMEGLTVRESPSLETKSRGTDNSDESRCIRRDRSHDSPYLSFEVTWVFRDNHWRCLSCKHSPFVSWKHSVLVVCDYSRPVGSKNAPVIGIGKIYANQALDAVQNLAAFSCFRRRKKGKQATSGREWVW
jgi:hypothetical protein